MDPDPHLDPDPELRKFVAGSGSGINHSGNHSTAWFIHTKRYSVVKDAPVAVSIIHIKSTYYPALLARKGNINPCHILYKLPMCGYRVGNTVGIIFRF